MSVRQGVRERLGAYRNPVYLMYALIGIAVFVFAAIIANSGAGPLEVALFRFFNSMSDSFLYLFFIVSLFGSLGLIIIISTVLAFQKKYGNAIKIFVGALSAYIIAYSLKSLDIRPRPYVILDGVNVREDSIGTYGFPSGHAAVATVLAITAYQYLPKRWHKPVTFLAAGVMASRMYLGVHLPMDLVGGFAVGLLCGGLVNFLLGSKALSAVDPKVVKKSLANIGLKARSVKLASVDARGSIPYFAELADGNRLFVKIVGKENNIADWLFKSWRKVVYRRLEDEAPFLGAKRQLEHEAYVSSLAVIAGVRTPKVAGVFETRKDRWAMAQYAVSGESLDRVSPKKLTDNILLKLWQQVEIMHSAGIVHRDLRCANVILDGKAQPWIIDFGFSEASMPDEAKNRDRAELIASITTLVGAKRSVNIAIKALGREKVLEASPYLTEGVLSSATAKTIKNSETKLPEIRALIAEKLEVKKVKPVELKRFSLKRIFLVIVIGIGIFVLVPQIEAFRTSLSSLQNARLWLVGAAAVFSTATYFFAAVSYRALFNIPIEFGRVFIVQVASSFASKLAPAGTGGLALNAKFITKNGHSLSQATSIALINNVMGFLAQIFLLGMVVLLGASDIGQAFKFDIPFSRVQLIVGASILATIAFAVFLTLPGLRKKLTKLAKTLGADITQYRNEPTKLINCFIASILTTLAYTGALYASAHALGSTLSPLQLLVVFTVGVAAASVTPTPGGVGGAEAGLVAALTATGMDAGQALSITLLYRLVTYWLPIVPGFIGFRYIMKREYV